MPKKSTDELLKELKDCESFKSYHVKNADSYSETTLAWLLKELMERKNLRKTDVIRRAEISDAYGFQIFNGERKPERNKLLCLCIAVCLELDDVQDILKRSGYSQLYVKNPADCVIIYGICKGLSVAEIKRKTKLPAMMEASAGTAAVITAVLLFVFSVSAKRPDSTVPDVDAPAGLTETERYTEEPTVTGSLAEETDMRGVPEDTADDGSDAERTDGSTETVPYSPDIGEKTEPAEDETKEDITYREPVVTRAETVIETEKESVDPPETSYGETTKAPETKEPETESPETKEPETTEGTETEPAETRHVHTDACRKWVVDKPYVPAETDYVLVIDVPYSPAEFGTIEVDKYDCHYRVTRSPDAPDAEDGELTFSSTDRFVEWMKKNGLHTDGELGESREIYGSGYPYRYETYGPYRTKEEVWGLIKPEQQMVSHIEPVVISEGQEEEGHYEYVCGY